MKTLEMSYSEKRFHDYRTKVRTTQQFVKARQLRFDALKNQFLHSHQCQTNLDGKDSGSIEFYRICFLSAISLHCGNETIHIPIFKLAH